MDAELEERSTASAAEDISISYEEDGRLVVKEIEKEILTKGAWTTILFRYQEYDRGRNDYGPEKYAIRRYQKRNGQYVPKSKFNISSTDQAQKIVDVLGRWIKTQEQTAS